MNKKMISKAVVLFFSFILFTLTGCASLAYELAYKPYDAYYYCQSEYNKLPKQEQEKVDKEYLQIVRRDNLTIDKDDLAILTSIEVLGEIYEAIQKKEIKCYSKEDVENLINIKLCNQINEIQSQKIILRLAQRYVNKGVLPPVYVGSYWSSDLVLTKDEELDLPISIFKKIKDKELKKQYVKQYLLSNRHMDESDIQYCFSVLNTFSDMCEIFSKSYGAPGVEAENRIDRYLSKLDIDELGKIYIYKKDVPYKVLRKIKTRIEKYLDSRTEKELLDTIIKSSVFYVRNQAIKNLHNYSSIKQIALSESIPLDVRLNALLRIDNREELVEQFINSYYKKPENSTARKLAVNHLTTLLEENITIDQTLLKLLVKETGNLSVKLRTLKRINDFDFRNNIYKELAQSDDLAVRNEALKHVKEYQPQKPKEQQKIQSIGSKKDKPLISAPSDISVGTCWFFNSTDIATCYHVIQGKTRYNIFSEKLNARIPLDLIAFDEEKDIAILRIQSTDVIKNQPFLSIESKDSHIADRVFTMGYPDPQRQGIKIKYTAGDINSNTGLIDAPWMYQVSVPIQKGNSGGPLINENGAVIGLIFATLKDDMYSTTQNVNYAVKVKYLMELAKRNNCDIFFQNLRERTKREIIKKCESAIYLIEAK